jgi:hypothetical protein
MTIETAEMNRRLVALARSPEVRFWRFDYDGLSLPERTFRTIWELEAEVNNGGFYQYFHNTSGRLAPEVVDALRVVGAAAMAAIVGAAIQTVGGDIAWGSDKERQAALETAGPALRAQLQLFDQRFYKYPDNLIALLYQYVCDHRGEMRAPADF